MKHMKKRIFNNLKIGIAFVMALALFLSAGCNQQLKDFKDLSYKEIEKDEAYSQEIKSNTDFVKVAENDYLELYIHGKTAEIKVYDKVNQYEIYSNPQTRNQDRLTLNVPSRDKLISQINVDYEDSGGIGSYSSYADGVKSGQYEFQRAEDGIRVDYVIGSIPFVFLAPRVLSIEKYEEMRERVVEDDIKFFESIYKFTTLSQYPSDEDRALWRTQFPVLDKRDVYITNVSEEGVAIGDRQYATPYLMNKIHQMFVRAGYTLEELEQDDEENEVPAYREPNRTINVSLIYKLEGDSLLATIPRDSIYFNRNNVQITHLTILPLFGAADESKSGYMLVPDGSGALIELNNEKKIYGAYNKPVYGRDKLVFTDELTIADSMMPLPVFGIKADDEAFIGIIEEGDAAARIVADISGKISQNNIISAKILINANSARSNQGLSSGLGKKYQNELLDTDLTMRYYFLKGDNAHYTGMALKYRDYLLANNSIKQQEIKDSIPLSISMVQSIIHKKSFVGIPREAVLPLTTFEQTQFIIEELMSRGVDDLILQVKNWSNNANLNTPFNRVDVLRELGGNTGFRQLIQFTADHNIDFYPVTNFQYISRNETFSGFNARTNSSRMLDNTIGYDYTYSLNTLTRNRNLQKNIVSPTHYERLISSYLKNYERYDIPSLSVGLMGIDLNPDYKDSDVVDRQGAATIVNEQIQVISDNGIQIAVDGGNLYAIQNAALIQNAPIYASMEYMCDHSVPFYQIVMNGVIPYTGPYLNMSSDYTEDVLKLIESGSYPAFEWIYETNDVLVDTDSNFYSINYLDWLDRAVEVYQLMNDTLGQCIGSSITNHTILEKNLVKVEYDNGIIIYVNYNNQVMTADGLEIGAEDYLVIGGNG
jgi:hypothetical protein